MSQTSGADLHLDLAVTSGRGVRAALTDALRSAVRSGRLTAGAALPSSRLLAGDLGLARATVVDAYEELTAEGWLVARQGAATSVAPTQATDPAPATPEPVATTPGPAHDLRPGRATLAAFPRAAWAGAVRRAVDAVPADALGYDAPAGRPELRAVLADYLTRVRGVRAAPDLPDRIVVTAGATEGLRLLASVLAGPGAPPIAVEEWGLHVHRRMLDHTGPATVPLPVDEDGARTDLLGHGTTTGVRAVVLTPAHQYPIGVPLDPARRTAAVAWARAVDGLVVEDDYDGEFRYDRRPVGALHGLDPDRVAYLGTASKALAPGLRLGWLVLPRRLVAPVRDRVTGGCGVIDQLALADLLSSGAYDRHVRAARRRHRRRREELAAAVAARAHRARLVGHPAGLHVLVDLPAGLERSALAEAHRRGIAVQGLGAFRHPDAVSPAREGLVVGYAGPSDSAWPGALSALVDLLGSVVSRGSAGRAAP